MATRHLQDAWPEIVPRLREARSVAVFLDFDGTLSRLRSRPEDAKLEPHTRRVLLRLAKRPHVRVFIISGRRRADLKSKIRVRQLRYLGLHGWEGRAELGESAKRLMTDFASKLGSHIGKLTGFQIEEKGPTLAVHYRSASGEAVNEARSVLHQVLGSLGERLRVIQGDRVWEMLPHNVAGKGVAARHHMRAYTRGALPIYVGNDATDEPAFAALSRGITVRVGPRRPTRAKFYLNDPGEVRQFLERLEAEISHENRGTPVSVRDRIVSDTY